MTIPLSNFDREGLPLGSDSRNMAYLYGLSDFFSFVFEDTDKANLLMEANAVKASEIYSRFLQLTSSLTLAGVQEQVGASIELILLTEEDQIGVLPKYRINKSYASAKFLANRPFLPTELLTEGVDFRVTQTDVESCVVQFAKPLDSYKFSKRPLQGGGNQYAIWITDVAIDEQLMYKNYGKLLGVDPEVSSEQFSNFVFGLYYMYLNGPTIRLLEQGLNLVLGIPLPREQSTVLDIRSVPETGQYLVITDNQTYTLPRGILPSVRIGDTVDVGVSIAKWIELKDFMSDGKWWLNVSIPPEIIRTKPASQSDRFASEGTRFDYLMTEYLYTHTFLIRINVGSFEDNQYFRYLPDILNKAKPAHTQPIFVWRIDMTEDDFGLVDEVEFSISTVLSTLASINSRPINSLMI